MDVGGTRRIAPGTVLVSIVLGLFLVVAVVSQIGRPPGPDSTSREYVRQEMAKYDSPPLMLPVRIPDGYAPSMTNNLQPAVESSQYDPTNPPSAVTAEMTFGNQRPDLRVVIVCTQYAAEKGQACASYEDDPRRITRRMGKLLVVISPASDEVTDIEEWRSVELTTDLERVTWMH